MDNYTVYHLHTENSLLDSCTNYKLYVDKAVELGQKAIAFSEHGNIYNWIDKKMYCNKMGIKYIHAVEVYLTQTHEEKIRDNFHTILIAKNHEGFLELNKLVDMSTREDHFYYKPRISFDEFLNMSNNIISTSACLGSPLNIYTTRENKITEDNPYFDLLAQKYDYYEIQYHKDEEQIKFNQMLFELSKKYNKPLIVGTDSHSINQYKAECRLMLQKAKEIKFKNESTTENEYDLVYKSYDELINMFREQNSVPEEIYLEAIANTNIVADSVVDFELDLKHKYPKLYENEDEVFVNRIMEKYEDKVKWNIIKDNPKYAECIQEELRVFRKLNMVGFMLFMSELITWCRESNIPVGFGRGSVGGSVIAYITDITDCDPIVWDTVFSRFCNEDRLEIGDIDVDFAPSDRQKVYDYIIEKFGENYTAYVLAMGTISDKGTIDEIGRALDSEWKENNKDKIGVEKSPYSLDKVAEIKSAYEADKDMAKETYPDLFYYFDGMLNTVISQSMHPAGIVVSPISLPDNYGTFYNGDGKRILTINMEEVHEVSLVKYDILGLKNIEIIKDTCEIINRPYPLSHEINWEDEAVWEDMIKSPVGIFQFEGDYAFDLLCRYKPLRINDMSLVNASLRPSGASYRDNLIAKKFNENPSTIIDDLLKSNNGYLVFQEDTIKFLTNICGFSGSEADNIRRAIGRKQKERLERALPQILEGYCEKSDKPRNVAEEEAKTFLQIIEDSSDYQFGYNHSTMYSMIGYTCAMLRYYYPLEFITAFLNNSKNDDDIKDGIGLAKLKGIKLEPIKFRYSGSGYTASRENNAIYQGIGSIKFCGKDIADELLLLKDKEYKNFMHLLADIKDNTSLNSKEIQILIMLQFFDEFGNNKKLMNAYKYFTKIYDRKTFKKEEAHIMGLKDVFDKYSTGTDKTYKNFNPLDILDEVFDVLKDSKYSIQEQIKNEVEYLTYPTSIWSELHPTVCIIIDIDDKYTPKLKIYSLSTGQMFEYKVYKKFFMSKPVHDNPEQFPLLGKFDVIQLGEIKERNKNKLVDGKWIPLDPPETELYLNSWGLIKEYREVKKN